MFKKPLRSSCIISVCKAKRGEPSDHHMTLFKSCLRFGPHIIVMLQFPLQPPIMLPTALQRSSTGSEGSASQEPDILGLCPDLADTSGCALTSRTLQIPVASQNLSSSYQVIHIIQPPRWQTNAGPSPNTTGLFLVVDPSYHLFDASVDSDCIHQLVVTARLIHRLSCMALHFN